MPNKPPGAVAVFAPSPLVTITLERSTTELDQLHIHLGGQGVWVARLVTRLGLPATLCGIFGGETGDVAQFLTHDDTFELRAVKASAWNGAHVHDRRSGDRRILVDVPPAPLSRHELDDLYSVTIAAALECGVCVLTGTHRHPVVPDEMYRRLAHDLHAHGVIVIADLSDSLLTSALEGGVTLVKVSEEELRRDGRFGDDDDDVWKPVDQILRSGAEHVVVSRGHEPCFASIGGHRFEVHAPTMDAVDPRGAGDAMTGMLAAGMASGWSTVQLLRLSAAAGAATVMRHGFATGTRDSIEALSTLVDVVEVDGAPKSEPPKDEQPTAGE